MAQIHVTIVEGRNLKKKDLFSENDPYVELYLNDKQQKRKTDIKRNSKTPKWDQKFTFENVGDQNYLYIDVYDKDLIFDDKIGSIKMNLQDLIKQKKFEGWYNLRSKAELTSYGEIHLILEYEPLSP